MMIFFSTKNNTGEFAGLCMKMIIFSSILIPVSKHSINQKSQSLCYKFR